MQPLLRYAGAIAGVAGMTAVIHAIPGATRISNISILYLLVVIGAALALGSGPAIEPDKTAVVQERWSKHVHDIPLVVLASPYRAMTEPILQYLDEVERGLAAASESEPERKHGKGRAVV
jgi:hypothetical protein